MPRAWTARATHWLYSSCSTGTRTGRSVHLPLTRSAELHSAAAPGCAARAARPACSGSSCWQHVDSTRHQRDMMRCAPSPSLSGGSRCSPAFSTAQIQPQEQRSRPQLERPAPGTLAAPRSGRLAAVPMVGQTRRCTSAAAAGAESHLVRPGVVRLNAIWQHRHKQLLGGSNTSNVLSACHVAARAVYNGSMVLSRLPHQLTHRSRCALQSQNAAT